MCGKEIGGRRVGGSVWKKEKCSQKCSQEDVASPAVAVLKRRLSRTTQEKRKQPCGDRESETGSETGSDGEWLGDDDLPRRPAVLVPAMLPRPLGAAHDAMLACASLWAAVCGVWSRRRLTVWWSVAA